MDISWYNTITMLIIGVVFTVVGVILRRKRARILGNGIKVKGEVVEIVKVDNNYYPVIEFPTDGKGLVTQKYNIGQSNSAYFKGDKVTLIYDPAKPSDFLINNSTSRIFDLGFLIIGILLLLGSVIMTFMLLFSK